MKRTGGSHSSQHMRWTALFFCSLMLAACASGPRRPEGLIDILSTSRGQALAGADCTVQTDSGSWHLQTPGAVNVGEPNGDLWVVCNRDGYRTSEVIIRAPGSGRTPGSSGVGIGLGGGFGGTSSVGISLGFGFPVGSTRPNYPAKVVVDLTPLSPPQ